MLHMKECLSQTVKSERALAHHFTSQLLKSNMGGKKIRLWLTVFRTMSACVLNFGFFSKGTFESLKNENNFLADGAISKILR